MTGPGAAALGELAARAATLADRLGPDWLPDDGADSLELARDRLDRWRQRAADGDDALFRQRLGWLGLTPEAALPRLGHGRLRTLPAWAEVVGSALGRHPVPPPQAEAHPFGPALAGFAAEALDRLSPACGMAFGPVAMATLVNDLYNQLTYLAGPSLQVEFAARRGEPPHGSGRERFAAFLDSLAAGGLAQALAEYAALARLLGLTVLHWSAHVSRMAEDFTADREAIAARFGCAVDARIDAIRPSLSDPHNGGRSVAIVTLTGGSTLVYKPRSLAVEDGWFALLGDLDVVCGGFRRLAVLSRGDHGWVETAQHRPCADPAEAAAYYRHAGNLLALLYALEASDCFHENIVADGAFPVLIDMETLMHFVLRPPPGDVPADAAAADVIFDSVLRAGFLPTWEIGRDGVTVDISGLGGDRNQVTPYLKRRWPGMNTDAMSLRLEPIRIDSDAHLPLLDGVALRAADHAEAVVAGFQETYRGLMAHRDRLLGPDGPLARLGPATLRLVFHPTRLYGLLLKRLATPKAMREGVERSLELEVIARFYLESGFKQPYRQILAGELAALERHDIPYFSLRADATDLVLPGIGRIDDAFAEIALDRARARIAGLDEADLALQTEFVRASLAMSVADARTAPAASLPDDGDDAPAPDRDALAAAALDILDRLEARAIRAADGAVTWVAPQLLPGTERYQLRPLRLDLYGGLAGVALFLAAAARVTGRGGQLAMAALVPVRRIATGGDLPGLLRGGYTIGGATGVGSVIYALTVCAHLLDRPELLEDAAAAARLLDDGAFAADRENDVMAGTAGAILGLLALHRATGERGVLETAVRAGGHLLDRRLEIAGGSAWSLGRRPPTTGLSHGAAGIALALARLGAAADARRFTDGARAALAFEAAQFDAAAGNWRDLRDGPDAPPGFMNTWCHGALGIGLARLAGLEVLDGPGIRADIAAAVRLNDGQKLTGKDGPCCGNMARADLLLAAARAGDGPTESGADLAGRVLARARRRGGFAISGRPGADVFDPSFHQGLSGIGYGLLRLAAPDSLPSILVWG